jgi:hypothetical protein
MAVSTVTLQMIVDIAQAFGDLEPALNVGGQSQQPALTVANDVMNAICGVPFPQKWNEMMIPQFYTNSYQQDYAVVYPNGSSLTNLSWLERGIVIDINNNSVPKPFRTIETGRELQQATGQWYANSGRGDPAFYVNYFPNYMLYYGTWGAPNVGTGSFGNNPQAGSTYTAPTSLGPNGTQNNPITQIQDANGNFLLLTTYGNEGVSAPLAAANATPGTTVS